MIDSAYLAALTTEPRTQPTFVSVATEDAGRSVETVQSVGCLEEAFFMVAVPDARTDELAELIQLMETVTSPWTPSGSVTFPLADTGPGAVSQESSVVDLAIP